MTLQELKEQIENIDFSKSDEEIYCDLRNTVTDYENDAQEFDFEYIFEDANIMSYDEAEEYAKSEMELGGLIRMYYFLGDATFSTDLLRIDAYGNLQDCYQIDLENLQYEILSAINDKLKEMI